MSLPIAQTDPAEFMFAHTGHVVTPFVFFDDAEAVGTCLGAS